jgi:hypothetical protein
MQFDVILTNPPFQDSLARGKTPHKLWIDFTKKVFSSLLKPGGILCQVSPSSFRSPSNDVLTLMKENQTQYINLETSKYFEGIGSTFADYAIVKKPRRTTKTTIYSHGNSEKTDLDDSVFYLPNDFCATSLSIHRKVIFDTQGKLPVKWDYVTCHNIRLKTDGSLSKERTQAHKYPVFHTNRQQWWSTNRQPWADLPKVMWTRSGYTKPFFDPGQLGGTDMAYYVLVNSESDGENLARNLNSSLMQYIFSTARWSGFGNERVFASLPDFPRDNSLSDADVFSYFGLTESETEYVKNYLG